MKKLLFVAALILIIGVSLQSVKNYNDDKLITNKPKVSDTSGADASQDNNAQVKSNLLKVSAKDFKLTDLNGNEVSLSQFKGKKVFLNFWATWCPPCKAEMPDIEIVYNETKDSDLVILAVNIGEKRDTVKSFIDKNKYHFTVLLDSTSAIANTYKIDSIPTSFFIDQDGNIISTHIGSMDKTQMRAYIKTLDKK